MPKRKTNLINLFVLLLVAAIIASCSPKTNHRVLSFFFDGVPAAIANDSITIAKKSNPTDSANKTSTDNSATVMAGSIHQPYKEGNCATCHNPQATGMFSSPMPQLCYTCHDDFAKKFAFVHGPVAAGYCNSCHNAHSAELPKLLIRKSQDLCLHCHEATLVFKNEVHAEIGETNCTDCHNPHGGSDKFLF